MNDRTYGADGEEEGMKKLLRAVAFTVAAFLMSPMLLLMALVGPDDFKLKDEDGYLKWREEMK